MMKRKSLLMAILSACLLYPVLSFAGGASGFINAGTFALVVQLGMGLTVIFLAWFVKNVLKIHIPKLVQAPLIWIAAFIVFRVILQPPLPFTILAVYMGIITIAIFLYSSIDEPSWQEFTAPIRTMLQEDTKNAKTSRYIVFAALPLLIGYGTYNKLMPKFEEPVELRTVHPAPPASINIHGKILNLQTEYNPFRGKGADGKEEAGAQYMGKNPFAADAPKYLQNVKEGGEIFFGTAGCMFCHGDNLDGRGMFAYAFNPIPANFADPGTIAQLQETFVLWRVAKGGPGVPRETFPWASAMPPWEKHLTQDEMWKVIMFEYWHTGFYPRTWD
jgi:hypothetical protein